MQEEIQKDFNKLFMEQAELSYRIGMSKADLARIHQEMHALALKLQALREEETKATIAETAEVSAANAVRAVEVTEAEVVTQ